MHNFFSESAHEWRVLGQEQDGTLLFSWVHSEANISPHTRIGIYDNTSDCLKLLHCFDSPTNVIQASINSSKDILAYVIKESVENEFLYKPYVLFDGIVHDLQVERRKQIMLQFLYCKQSVLTKKQPDRLLVLIHQECKFLHFFQEQLKSSVKQFIDLKLRKIRKH